MKNFKNYLICVVTSLLAFTFFFGLPSLSYSSELKSAEQSVYDLFEAVQKNDYDTYKKVSMHKLLNEDIRRNTLQTDYENRVFAEKLTILSSEMSGKDKVMVKVSYVIAGEERKMIYPVVLVNNEWVVDLTDAVPEGENIIFLGDTLEELLETNSYKTNLLSSYWPYSDILRMVLGDYSPFCIASSVMVCSIVQSYNARKIIY